MPQPDFFILDKDRVMVCVPEGETVQVCKILERQGDKMKIVAEKRFTIEEYNRLVQDLRKNGINKE